METFAREKFQKFRDTATFKVLSPFILTVYRYMVSVIKWSEIYMYSSVYLHLQKICAISYYAFSLL